MQLGYNIWNQDQVDHIDGLLVSLKELGINWVGIVPSFLLETIYTSDLKFGYPKGLDAVLDKCKSAGFNILLKPHIHAEYAFGATPVWWPGYIHPSDHRAITRQLFKHIKPYIPYADNVCIGAEIDGLTVFQDDWIELAQAIKSVKTLGVIYGGNGFQALREQYASQIDSYIRWESFLNWFRWWRPVDPYKALIDQLISTGALGDQKIPDSMKGDLARRLLSGRPKLLNPNLDGCGLQFYYTPPMEVANNSGNAEAVYMSYRNFSAPLLGSIDYVQSVRNYSQGQDLWLTETSYIPPYIYDEVRHKQWLKGTIVAMKETGALIAFLWTDRTDYQSDENIRSLRELRNEGFNI